jgi:hypothetical protein
MLDRFGTPVDSVGDSTGLLPFLGKPRLRQLV